MTDSAQGQVSNPSGRGLHVLFAVREDWRMAPGGDTVQIYSTAGALRRMGVKVSIGADPQADPGRHDLVHIFHLGRVHESYPHFVRARSTRTPVVVSTIYWPIGAGADSAPGLRTGIVEGAKNAIRWATARSSRSRRGALLALRTGYVRSCRLMAGGADMLLPNSRAEMGLLRRHFGGDVHATVVTNGVDADLCRNLLSISAPARHRQVLCVGHFDPRKNQLRLIEALNEVTDLPVFFIGAARGMHGRYWKLCRRRARSHMHFLGPLGGDEVMQWMRRSTLYVGPALVETPGLAALGAAAMGCALALGRCGPVVEYFGERASYFDPLDPADIHRCVTGAVDEPPPAGLGEYVLDHFTWSSAARATLDAYRTVLEP